MKRLKGPSSFVVMALVLTLAPLAEAGGKGKAKGKAKGKGKGDDSGEMTFGADDMTKPTDKPDDKGGDTTGGDQGGDTTGGDQSGDTSGGDQSGTTGADSSGGAAGGGDTLDLGGDLTSEKDTKADVKLGENRVSWQDIVVVVRKPFLKVRRLELLPTWGITMNDNIIQHFQFSAAMNYFLTDVLAVGLEGDYYVKNLREPYDLVARQARRLPTVNKYNYGASLNFHYVPIYGKFAILDKHIVHWETFFTAGIGFTQSEVIPRDPALQPFTNFLITPNVGASMRFFVNKFLTVDVGIRDYVFVDKFEKQGRTVVSAEMARAEADSSLINNVVFQSGVSFWFPTSFEYTTFR